MESVDNCEAVILLVAIFPPLIAVWSSLRKLVKIAFPLRLIFFEINVYVVSVRTISDSEEPDLTNHEILSAFCLTSVILVFKAPVAVLISFCHTLLDILLDN